MVIALIICIPITALVVGFLVLKSVHIGLKWQFETRQGDKPTLDVNPIKPVIEAVTEHRQAEAIKEQQSIFDEWVNGPKER